MKEKDEGEVARDATLRRVKWFCLPRLSLIGLGATLV